jgi:cobalt/nickel transport system permease protein
MHISDGFLSPAVIAAGWVVTAILLALTLRRGSKTVEDADEIPKISIMTAAFFVASLIHVSLGPTSVHLILNGLLGVILGFMAFPAMFIGLLLQALLFQHGGITTLGVNTMVMGVPALIVHFIFRKGYSSGINPVITGAFCGGFAVAIAAFLLAVVLITTGEEFTETAYLAVVAHIPIIIIETIITGAVVGYLLRVRPELLPIEKEV